MFNRGRKFIGLCTLVQTGLTLELQCFCSKEVIYKKKKSAVWCVCAGAHVLLAVREENLCESG